MRGASYTRYISVGYTPNGHVDERMEGRMISSVKFHGNREWKEAALVGPSLPLIVSPYFGRFSFSPFLFKQLRSFFPSVLLASAPFSLSFFLSRFLSL